MANSDEHRPLLVNEVRNGHINQQRNQWMRIGCRMLTSSRSHWDSSLFGCLGRNDEFCSRDFEVCLLGTLVPCVLYGSNVERLGSEPRRLSLYLLGNSHFGWNCLAPWFSYSSCTQIRQRFNLELILCYCIGSFEGFKRSCGCFESLIEDEDQLEQCESSCDLAAHLFCHACSLCQEG
ncbi:hypothetical protein MKX01_004490 [Papaver californicum]|nr:hypothetical protein MKX01_004490 [Papaver californicum]